MSGSRSAAELSAGTGTVMIAAIFVVAVCGLIYELIAGALSSYLMGNSVTQFSLVIGLFLTAMGAGSYLSRFIHDNLAAALIAAETAVGVIGGLTALAGFAAFALSDAYVPVLLTMVAAVGILVGLEVPLVIRILRDLSALPTTLANVLAADYVGALAASLLFPYVLLPHLGLVRAGTVMGLVNVGVAAVMLRVLRPGSAGVRRKLGAGIVAASILLATATVFGGTSVNWLEGLMYQDEILLAKDTPYQRMVVTRWRDDVRLYLDGHLQFSSVDEYRYHESLVHPAMGTAGRRDRVLVLGGGDGMAAREILAYPEVQSIDVVDLDSAVTDIFRDLDMLAALNDRSLHDPRVNVISQDAFSFLREGSSLYDVIVIDLPDPSRVETAKLYSRAFYGLAMRRLAVGGTLVTQASSPFRSREAFWCIASTMESALADLELQDMHVIPYHVYIPTFGTWGFALATRAPKPVLALPAGRDLRFLCDEVLDGMLVFPADMARVETAVSTLDRPVVRRLYVEGYHRYLE